MHICGLFMSLPAVDGWLVFEAVVCPSIYNSVGLCLYKIGRHRYVYVLCTHLFSVLCSTAAE